MRWVARGLVALVVLAVVLAVVLFGWSAALVVSHGRADGTPKRADAIVVLGAAQFNGRPGPYLQPRLEHALALYRAGLAKHVITVGGNQPGDEYTEAGTGRDWLVARGVPASAVTAVEEGSNTLDSLRGAARVLRDQHWDTAIVVTDRWHELRSTTMLADQGITSHGSPVTTGPSVAGLVADARYVVREAAGYLAYRVQRALS